MGKPQIPAHIPDLYIVFKVTSSPPSPPVSPAGRQVLPVGIVREWWGHNANPIISLAARVQDQQQEKNILAKKQPGRQEKARGLLRKRNEI